MKRKIEEPSQSLLEAMQEAKQLEDEESDGQPVEVVLAELKLACLK